LSNLKRKFWSIRCLSIILALAMVMGFFQFAVQPASASAVGTFSLYIVDKGGTRQLIGSWSYDSTNCTFKNESGEAPFITTYDSTSYLRYSGQDNYYGYTGGRLAICKKGITVPDLVSYAESATGIPFNDSTSVFYGVGTSGFTYQLSYYNNRYYYPTYIINKTFDDSSRVAVPTSFAILSYNQRNLAGSSNNGWGSATACTAANGGVEVPVATDSTSLDYAFNILYKASDDLNSLRILWGQQADHTVDMNLGGMSYKNVNTVAFTPVYLTLNTSVTNDDSSSATATIATDDGYLKAAAGESVSFKVSDVTTGYGIKTVSVTDASGASVSVSEGSGSYPYSFTMPSSAAAIHVDLARLAAVTFMSNGSPYSSVSAMIGSSIDAPAAPNLDGYTFNGWYTDTNYTTQVVFPYTVTGEVTFYAYWGENSAPTPELPAAVLFGLGAVGIGGFLVIRRKKQAES
jgi:uncharacterized repeat protein (TIGR02543 family)